MKVFICLFAVLAVTQARVNWDNVRSATVTPYPNGIPDVHQDEEDVERIIEGVEVEPHSRPFQVGLIINFADRETFFCGGSLVSPDHVLTAAHCCEKTVSALDFKFVLGAHNISNEDEPGQVRIRGHKKTVHKKWNSKSKRNDICLLQLETPVELNENISIVTLPSRSDVGNTYEGELTTVSGWGKVSDSATNISAVLRETSNPVLAQVNCMAYMPTDWTIRRTHLCVSGTGHHSFCSGDDGGPLTVVRNGEVIQIGIASADAGPEFGCERGFPTVYTRLTKYLNWIEENSNVVIRP